MKKMRFLFAFLVISVIFSMFYLVSAVENSSSSQCTDSDGGTNYNVKGLVIPRAGDEQVWDSCQNDNVMLEGTCDEQGGKVYEYKCPNGCLNGACVILTTNQSILCTDSDNGLNYYVKGTTKWKVDDGSTNTQDDYCVDKNTLSEGICGKIDENGKIYRREPYNCVNGCENGACIQKTSIPCDVPDCQGRIDSGKLDTNDCKIYTCPKIPAKCEDYSYNNCPGECAKIIPPCPTCPVSDKTEPTPTCPSCRAPYCATPGQKEGFIKVYLNQKFELKTQEIAKVIDYKNMEIKSLGTETACASCSEEKPCPPNSCYTTLRLQVSISSREIICTPIAEPECSEGTKIYTYTGEDGCKKVKCVGPIETTAVTTSTTSTTSSTSTTSVGGNSGGGDVGIGSGPRSTTSTGTVFNIGVGEKKDVFGASISLLKLEKETGLLVVERPIIIKPICGNNICEVGEGEVCEAVEVSCQAGKECKSPPANCYTICLQDCGKEKEPVYIELGDKFKLQISQTAKLKSENLNIQFKNMIAYKCDEEIVSSKGSTAAIKEKVEEAEQILTGSVVSNIEVSKPFSVLRCVGSGPKALLHFGNIEGEKILGVLELNLKEKKKLKNRLTVAFLDYDYASRTGAFIINRESFSCPEKCKCDIEGNTISCPDKNICEENKILCPDGKCREKCEINSTQECTFGCNYEGACFPISVRNKGLYCATDQVMNSQKGDNEQCENNFECKSNVCVAGKCINQGLVERIINWFKRLFGGS
ncbi:hypothetical protein HYW75_02590 [Candidatus Pacearchaeota archaeon]|nr:hypothetical protein [Candidatus Pacearchaeota archaeon]